MSDLVKILLLSVHSVKYVLDAKKNLFTTHSGTKYALTDAIRSKIGYWSQAINTSAAQFTFKWNTKSDKAETFRSG
jgi:hypothetical protein